MKMPNIGPSSKKRQYIFLKLADFSKKHVALFALMFGAIGGIYLLSNSFAARPVPSIYLTPETATVAPNTEFTVEVRVDSGTTPVNAVQANFNYPADLVDFVRTDGAGSAFAKIAPAVDNSGSNGSVKIGRYTDTDATTGLPTTVTGDVLLAKVTFKTKATANTATLAFVDGTYVLNGTTSADILGSLAATAGAVITIGTGGGGTPPPNPPPPGTCPKLGDINCDNQVDLADLAAFLLLWGTSDTKADFDKDGRVGIFDLSIMLSKFGS